MAASPDVAAGCDDDPIDARALSKLRWRCRRGLLENDLFVERFFARPEPVTVRQARGLTELMALADNDLLDLLLRRTEPPPGQQDVRAVLQLMRAPPPAYRIDPAFELPEETA